jgi:hypothetical protein
LAATVLSVTASACNKGMSASSMTSKKDSNKWAALENSNSSSQPSAVRSAVAVKGADGAVRR